MLNTLCAKLPLYPVLEYPKSGGSWFSQLLADALTIPFPRNRRPPLAPCVMHGHHLYNPRFRNVVCVLRDGRDVIVSAYYHFLFDNERNLPHFVARHRHALGFDDYDDIARNLPRFIDYLFVDEAARRRHFSWAQFVMSWLDRDVVLVRYEALLADAATVLGAAVEQLTGRRPSRERLDEIVARHSFRAVSGREPGTEDVGSFLRKGIAGDWLNHFTPEARARFRAHGGDALIAAGYEPNHDWADAGGV